MGCSQFYLRRIFAQEMGKSITAYLRDLRLERAALLLRTGDCNVTEAALEVGYSNLSQFMVAFRELFGLARDYIRPSPRTFDELSGCYVDEIETFRRCVEMQQQFRHVVFGEVVDAWRHTSAIESSNRLNAPANTLQ